jgi:hypothetical protein
MKNLQVEIIYVWEDDDGKEIRVSASAGGNWHQWGSSQENLEKIMPLTEKINDAVNDFIIENCEEDYL